jgi:hypothetical protein
MASYGGIEAMAAHRAERFRSETSPGTGCQTGRTGNVAVVVIDPISAYLGATDSHKNSDIRGLLAPLSEMAARHNVAIIGVLHMTKAAGAKALMRVNPSLAFVAAARAAFVVVSDSMDKTRRLFLPMKNNVGPDSTGLTFRIEGAIVASSAGPLATSRVRGSRNQCPRPLMRPCRPRAAPATLLLWTRRKVACGKLLLQDR